MNSREFLLGIIVAPPGAASDGTEPLPALGQFHNNVLRTFPQCLAPKHVEVLEARRERDEMVGWKLAGFRRKMRVAVRQEDFRLAYAAWIQDDLAGSRIGDEIYMCVAKPDYRITIYIIPEGKPSYLQSRYPPTKAFPFLGVSVSEVVFGSDDAKKKWFEEMGKEGGVLVEKVIANSPAEKAGLEEADIIMSFNNRKTRTLREFLSDLAGAESGERVPMCIMRGDVRKTVYVILEKSTVSLNI